MFTLEIAKEAVDLDPEVKVERVAEAQMKMSIAHEKFQITLVQGKSKIFSHHTNKTIDRGKDCYVINLTNY